MKKIFCDLDDVICENSIVDLVNQFLHTKYKFEDLKEGYDCRDLVKDEKQLKQLYTYVVTHNFYIGAKLKPNCKRVLKKLQTQYEIYILSACLVIGCEDLSGIVYKNKFDFIRKNLPFINPKNIVFTNAKGVVKGDVMIDDRFSNLNGDFQTKLLFDCCYNHSLTDETLKKNNVKRVHNWKDIEKILLK